MSKVQFIYATGRQKAMRLRDAELLRRLGKGTYLTRDMRAQPSMGDGGTDGLGLVQTTVSADKADGLDNLDRDELHALAKERGLKIHHAAGADKVRAALREASE